MLRVCHCLPRRLRLQVRGAQPSEALELALRLGAEWHPWSGSLLLWDPPSLGALALRLEEQGWWLEAPGPGPAPKADTAWEQVTLEVGASLMGAALGEPLGRWLGAGLAGPAGGTVGAFLGLVVGAVLGTELLDRQRRSSDPKREMGEATSRLSGRVAGRLGEEVGALTGLRLGALLGGPLGATSGALLGTLVMGQLGEDAALHHTEQWRQPLRWLRQTGRMAAGEAASQSLFGLLGGALLQTPGRRAGERVGLYLGRRIDWQRFRPLAVYAPVARS